MHKSTLMLKGTLQGSKVQFKIKGGFFGESGDPTIENPCVETAICKTFSLLGGKADEVKKTLCFNELVSQSVVKYLDYWIKKEKMMFFVWKGQLGNIFVFFEPFTSDSFEVDETLEELLLLTALDPTIRNCGGTRDDRTTYDVTRTSNNAREVICHQSSTNIVHVAYVGVGAKLRDAIRGVSTIINR